MTDVSARNRHILWICAVGVGAVFAGTQLFCAGQNRPTSSSTDVSKPSGQKSTKVVYVDAFERNYAKGEVKHQIDAARFGADIQKAINELETEGYRVTSVLPVIRGGYDKGFLMGAMIGSPLPESAYGLGFSRTDGVILIASR